MDGDTASPIPGKTEALSPAPSIYWAAPARSKPAGSQAGGRPKKFSVGAMLILRSALP